MLVCLSRLSAYRLDSLCILGYVSHLILTPRIISSQFGPEHNLSIMKSKTKTYTRLLNVSIDLALRVMWYLLLEADVGSGKWFLGDKRTGEIT